MGKFAATWTSLVYTDDRSNLCSRIFCELLWASNGWSSHRTLDCSVPRPLLSYYVPCPSSLGGLVRGVEAKQSTNCCHCGLGRRVMLQSLGTVILSCHSTTTVVLATALMRLSRSQRGLFSRANAAVAWTVVFPTG